MGQILQNVTETFLLLLPAKLDTSYNLLQTMLK